jgi:Flp pilus assembly secretin CpaC
MIMSISKQFVSGSLIAAISASAAITGTALAADPSTETGAPMSERDMAMLSQGNSGLGSPNVVNVSLDKAKVLRITQPVSTIVIGNPAIADASLPDEQTLVLTGRGYGETNILMLDDAGSVVADYVIYVGNTNERRVSVYRRTARTSLSCTPDCQPSPTLGDSSEPFNEGITQIQTRNGLAQGFADGDSQ